MSLWNYSWAPALDANVNTFVTLKRLGSGRKVKQNHRQQLHCESAQTAKTFALSKLTQCVLLKNKHYAINDYLDRRSSVCLWRILV